MPCDFAYLPSFEQRSQTSPTAADYGPFQKKLGRAAMHILLSRKTLNKQHDETLPSPMAQCCLLITQISLAVHNGDADVLSRFQIRSGSIIMLHKGVIIPPSMDIMPFPFPCSCPSRRAKSGVVSQIQGGLGWHSIFAVWPRRELIVARYCHRGSSIQYSCRQESPGSS
jgi:hypothetical protein